MHNLSAAINGFRDAKIIFSGNLPPAECKVVDLSAGGACLEVSGAGSLPKNFELVVGAVRKKCKVVWRAGWRLGVSF
jgi:hypothetical protein